MGIDDEKAVDFFLSLPGRFTIHEGFIPDSFSMGGKEKWRGRKRGKSQNSSECLFCGIDREAKKKGARFFRFMCAPLSWARIVGNKAIDLFFFPLGWRL